MKFIKLSIFALTMGLFIASCGNGENKEGTTDSSATTTETPAADAAPVAEPAPVTDTTTAPPADTTHANTPAAH